MTVCIAAINHKEKALVYASDRMVTSGYPPVEFEHPIPKTIKITSYCVALSAGNALLKMGLCQQVRSRIAGKNLSIEEIAGLTRDSYQQFRLNRIEELVLKSRGLNLELFWREGVKLLPAGLYSEIQKSITLFDYEFSLIIAGVDAKGPSIYGLQNPGILDCFDSIGFHTIGSGRIHAFQSLISTYDPKESIEKTLYETYKAKKDAEIAPGVGKDVDLGLITQNGQCIDFTQDHIKIKDLEKFYENTQKTTKNMLANADFSSIINNGGDKKKNETK